MDTSCPPPPTNKAPTTPPMHTLLVQLVNARFLLPSALPNAPWLCALLPILDRVFSPFWWMDAVQFAPGVKMYTARRFFAHKVIPPRDSQDNAALSAPQKSLAPPPHALMEV